MRLINIYFNSFELKTLGDFLSNESVSPAFSYVDSPKDFLDIVDETGRSNKDKIISSYNGSKALENDLNRKYNSGNFNSIPIVPPTVFTIDSEKAVSDLFSTQGDLVQNTFNVNYFISKRLANIVQNPGYKIKGKNNQVGGVSTLYPKLNVWIWCRTLSEFSGNPIQLLNISAFVESMTLNSSKEGANFNLSLAPINATFKDGNEGWKISKASFKEFKDSNGRLNYNSFSHVSDVNGKNAQFYFHNVISPNDLVFISFDELEFESNPWDDKLSVPFEAVQGKIWDCIGLVDSNSISQIEGVSTIINISGRDLTKAIIEDGSYFWATEFGFDGTIRFAGNRDNRIVRRVNSGPEGLMSYFSIANKSIEYSLKFVVSQLANTGFVPNGIFDPYGNRRSSIFINGSGEPASGTAFNGDIVAQSDSKLEQVYADGIWSIVKIIVDPQIANLRVVDSTLFTEQGSLINYINRICQEPFVEFYTETIGDMFYFIARRPPYDKDAILDSINGISVSDQDEITELDREILGEENVMNPIRVTNLGSFVLDVDGLDVIEYDLSFDDRVYTWFKLEPKYVLGGGADNINSLALFPAIFLPTYVNIWGSRPLNQESNYVNYVPSTGKIQEMNYNNAIEQAFYDLSWLVRTHAYLPFTRRGSIVIMEDRRIKKGMHIRFKPTGEIFLVTGVSHSMSIYSNVDRRTTLQVERGMVEEFIEGVDVEGVNVMFGENKKVSYFTLVDTPVTQGNYGVQFVSDRKDPINTVLANWRENEEVIKFFLQKRQFANG